MIRWIVYKNSYMYKNCTWHEVLELQCDALMCRDYGIFEKGNKRISFDEYIDDLEGENGE